MNFIKSVVILALLYVSQSHAQLSFKNLDSLPVGLIFHASVSDGKSLYAINGQCIEDKRHKVSAKIYRFDTLTQKWSVFADWLVPKVQAVAEYLPSTNKVYIIGGASLLDYKSFFTGVETVDLKTGLVEKLPVTNPFPTLYAGSAVWKDKIYIFGGSTVKGIASNKLFEYDTKNNTFSSLPDMPEGKQVAGEIVDGVLYTFGGFNDQYKLVSDHIDAYDIASKTWKQVAKLPIPVSANAVAKYGHLIYVAGSYNDLHFLGYFDTRKNTFTQLTSDMIGRRHAGMQILSDKLYIFGGNTSNRPPWLSSTQVANLKVK